MRKSLRSVIGKLARRLGFWKIPDRRRIRYFPDDVFIVSYPKSGNTWVRFLVAGVLHGSRAADFTTIERLIPTIYHASDRQLNDLSRPRMLKSHEYFHPEYAKVIYIVRDPRDVAVSYYHFLRRGNRLRMDHPIHLFTPELIAGKLDKYGTWKDHVTGWLKAQEQGLPFILVRYEDLLQDTESQLQKIAEFLGLTRTAGEIREIVAACSSSRMRELERSAGSVWIDSADSDIPFVRRATSGGWREELDAASQQLIENSWGDIMQKLGYLL